MGRAEALRRTMVAIIDNDANPAHQDPRYWAPFSFIGYGGH
ncbi:MAG: CHAT domain-containing protein [Hyphomicrobiaceae bacterium]